MTRAKEGFLALLLFGAVGCAQEIGGGEPVDEAGGGGAMEADAGARGGEGGSSGGGRDGAPAGGDGGAAVTRDRFGVQKIYPTVTGGREFSLPDDGRATAEFKPEGLSAIGGGVFRMTGDRLNLVSPSGAAWWRNVEMTVYLRNVSGAGGDARLTLFARGERQTNSDSVAASSINEGVAAPSGTTAWPGYPFSGSVNGHCLGTAYRGTIFPSGAIEWRKEISHSGGYTGAREEKSVFAGGLPASAWFGYKVVIRNFAGDSGVRLETFVDRAGDGRWERVAEVEDRGGWAAQSASIDGCTAAPFRFRTDQVLSWSGAFATLRLFSLTTDLKWYSVREIEPLREP